MQERRPITTPISHVPIIYPALFCDDASGTFTWIATGDGADWDASYQTVAAFVGTKGIRLRTRATGPTTGDKATMSHYFNIPPTNLLRFRVNLAQYASSPDGFIYLLAYWFSGTNYYSSEIMLNTADQKVYYAATLRANYTDTALVWYEAANVWTIVDFTVDLNTHTWQSLRVNNQLLDMSSISLPETANAAPPNARFYLEVETAANAVFTNYFDQILITAENP